MRGKGRGEFRNRAIASPGQEGRTRHEDISRSILCWSGRGGGSRSTEVLEPEPPPRLREIRWLRDFVFAQPPLLARRGNRSPADASSISMPPIGPPLNPPIDTASNFPQIPRVTAAPHRKVERRYRAAR